MHALGFGHVLLLALTEDDCKIINQAVPDVGCGWTTFTTPPDMTALFALWSLRYRFLVRQASSSVGSCYLVSIQQSW